MKPKTLSALYEVKDLMARAITILNTRMFQSADSLELPEEDMACCHKIHDVVCKIMDLL